MLKQPSRPTIRGDSFADLPVMIRRAEGSVPQIFRFSGRVAFSALFEIRQKGKPARSIGVANAIEELVVLCDALNGVASTILARVERRLEPRRTRVASHLRSSASICD